MDSITLNRQLEIFSKELKPNDEFGQHEFLKDQSPFVHQVVRLAKFWSKTLNMGTYISGRSTMIELIAIHAGKIHEYQRRDSTLCLESFETFLNMMSKFDTICIKYRHNDSEGDIPNDVKTQRPLVLDPLNPQNNLACFRKDEKEEITRKLKEFATETLKRIDNHPMDFNQLFEVQPKKFVGEFPQPQKWFIDTRDEKLIHPIMKVNMDEKKFAEKNWNAKDVQQCLMTTIAAASLGSDGRGVDMDQVKKKVQDCVDVNILGLASPRDWNWNDGSNFGNPNYDVILSIPVPGNSDKSVVFNASW